jgi:hypothetical protein
MMLTGTAEKMRRKLRRAYHYFVPTCDPPPVTPEMKAQGVRAWRWDGRSMQWIPTALDLFMGPQ